MRLLIALVVASLAFGQQKLPSKVSEPTPDTVVTGLLAITQDGKIIVVQAGQRLRIVDGKLDVIMPPQHVGQAATFDASTNTWNYQFIGKNVQVWRNGFLQKLGKDYALVPGKPQIVPKHFKTPVGSQDAWNPEDVVMVATLY